MTGAGTLGPVPPNPDLRSRIRGMVRELGKFGTVGGFAFLVDLVIYNLLLQAGWETLIAKALSTTVATTIAFLGNRFWTWRDEGDHVGMTRQYTTFFVLNLIGLGISLACLAISHYGLGSVWAPAQTKLADNIAGLGVGTALGTLFRFWSYRRYVFRVNAAPGVQSPASQ